VGQNAELLYRASEGRSDRFPALAAELVQQKVDVLVTRGTPATLAARKKGAGRIPVITTAVADPVETKLVKTLEAPGGAITGLTSSTNELGPKRLELLKALAPSLKRVGAIMNLGNPAAVANWKVIEGAAPGLSLQVRVIDTRKPEDISPALSAALRDGVQGLIVGIETLSTYRSSVIRFAAQHRLPAVYSAREFVEAGGLMSYGVSYPNLYYRAAGYIDKVLKGASPATLAMESPSKFELVIHRRTAFALKLAIPPDLLLRSDKIVG
jgi:putative tryptophan/tyrosine transport system substrate-binding protein